MRNEHELDRLFRQKLDQSKVEHPGHLWDGLQQRLDEIYTESLKKRRLFFFTVGLILLGGIVGAGILLNKEEVKVEQDAIQSNIDQQIADNELNIKSIQEIDNELSKQNNQNIAQESHIASHSGVKGKAQGLSAVITDSKHSPLSENQVKIKIDRNNIPAELHTDEIENDVKENIVKETAYNESGNLMDRDQIVYIPRDNLTITPLDEVVMSPAQSLDRSKPYDILVKEGCLDYVDKPFSKMFIEIFGGTQKADRLLYTENEDWQKNVNTRNASETVKTTFSFGARFNYMFDRGISLKTGFLYTAINEEFKYQSGEIQIIHRDSDGNITKTTYEPIYSTQNNVYKFYDIPLLLSYNWSKKGLFAEFNSGFLMNFYAEQSGEFYNIEGDRVGFENTQNSFGRPFKKFIGASLYTSASIGYEFSNNASLFIEPHIRYFLRSISAKAYPIEQKYINYGIYLGARYRIK